VEVAAVVGAAVAPPHSGQNFAAAGRGRPQAAQPAGSRWPHASQNFVPAGFA